MPLKGRPVCKTSPDGKPGTTLLQVWRRLPKTRFYEDFKRSKCYARSFDLEKATDGTFLETFFTVQHDHIVFRLKNVNEGEVKKVWRYQAWDSYSPNEQKWRTLLSVYYMASNEKEVFVSAMHKLREFANLGYPVSVRKGACYRVARDGGGLAWLAAAKAQGA